MKILRNKKLISGELLRMDDEIEDLISDLKVLSSSIEEDFNNRFWANYEKYLHDYNSMLEKTNIFIGICFDISPIKPVPSGEKAIIRVGTVAEQAKLREINVATKTLLERLNAINKKHILSDKQKLIIALIALIFGISYWATNGMYKHINDFTLSDSIIVAIIGALGLIISAIIYKKKSN